MNLDLSQFFGALFEEAEELLARAVSEDADERARLLQKATYLKSCGD